MRLGRKICIARPPFAYPPRLQLPFSSPVYPPSESAYLPMPRETPESRPARLPPYQRKCRAFLSAPDPPFLSPSLLSSILIGCWRNTQARPLKSVILLTPFSAYPSSVILLLFFSGPPMKVCLSGFALLPSPLRSPQTCQPVRSDREVSFFYHVFLAITKSPVPFPGSPLPPFDLFLRTTFPLGTSLFPTSPDLNSQEVSRSVRFFIPPLVAGSPRRSHL